MYIYTHIHIYVCVRVAGDGLLQHQRQLVALERATVKQHLSK